jgi:NIMA (never in mitosis gene a)-related kinase
MDRYDELATLGRGGSGRAILARRKSDNHQVVVKEVRLTRLSSKDREAAMREVSVLSSLKHPYIVEYFESFQDRGCLYIVMGYAEGGDLASRIRAQTSPFVEAEVLHDFIELALALRYVHSRKILHRDLKGQNVFLTGDGTVKLGDFGIARVLETTFQSCRTKLGTPYYLPPEICQGRNYNTKADIWGLGCVLYELCTGKHPFEGRGLEELMRAIIAGRVAPIGGNYSLDLKSLVDKMLTKDPVRRPSMNQILEIPFIRQRLSLFLDAPQAPRQRLLAVSDIKQQAAAARRRREDPKPDSIPGRSVDGTNAPAPERLLGPQIYELAGAKPSESVAATEPSEKVTEPDGVSQNPRRRRRDAQQMNADVREQPQANRATVVNMDELIAEAEREQQEKFARRRRQPDVSPLWEQRERLKKMNLSEVKAFMRRQKQTHKPNPDGIDMDELIADAELEQSQNQSKSGTERPDRAPQRPLLTGPKGTEQFAASQQQPEPSLRGRLLDSNALNASMAYRAETIRAFLEQAIGLEKLIALRHGDPQEASRGCAPGVVELAEELLDLEQTIDAM